MAIDQERMMQSIHDIIYDSLTAAPSGTQGAPVRDANSTFITLQFPGNPIDAEQFRGSAATPDNPTGSTTARELLSWLVDAVPSVSSLYAQSGNSVDNLYGQVVMANVEPTPTTPAAQAAYQDALRILQVDGTAYDDNGTPYTTKVDSPVFVNYQNKRSLYLAALTSYMANFQYIDLSTPQGQRTWSLIQPIEQAKVDIARQAFQNANRTLIENALATRDQFGASNLSRIFNDARNRYDATKRGSLLFDGLQWHETAVFPGNWFHESAAANFTGLTISSSRYYRSERSRFSSYSAGGSGGWGLWRAKASSSGQWSSYDMSTSTDSISVSFKFGAIEIRRPWLDMSLLTLQGWSLAGRPPGALSSGTLPNEGAFPLLPTAFIVARDIKIWSSSWGSDLSIASSSSSSSAGGGWGPFSLSGRYERSSSNRTFTSTFDGTTITVPGIQIIGWVNRVVPYSPPNTTTRRDRSRLLLDVDFGVVPAGDGMESLLNRIPDRPMILNGAGDSSTSAGSFEVPASSNGSRPDFSAAFSDRLSVRGK